MSKNNAIIIDYDPFAMESRISICKEGNKEYARVYSSMEELTNGIISLAYANEIYNIKVHGPFAVSGEIRRAINEREKDMYSQNKITVEGI